MEPACPAPDDFQGFWSWFAESQGEILAIIRGSRPGRVTERFDAALSQHRLGHVTYEVTADGGVAELVFTPEGDPTLASTIDALVQAAPRIDGWRILPRIPRRSLRESLAIVRALFGIDVSDARMKVIEHDELYHLCFLHDAWAALPEERRLAVAVTLLDHALGEQFVMDTIGQIEIRPAGDGVSLGLLINELTMESVETNVG